MQRRNFIKILSRWCIGLGLFSNAKSLSALGLEKKEGYKSRKRRNREPSSSGKDVEIRVLLGELSSSNLGKLAKMSIGDGQINYAGRSYQFRRSKSGKSYAGIRVAKRNPIKYNGHDYYGKIIVLRDQKSLQLINQLPIEEYLKGVVSKEISASWRPAVLQAQVIAARSYAYNHLLKNRKKSYHVDGTEKFQVFEGNIDKVPSSIVENVEKTRGKILTYRNEPIITFFHACCGGMTEKAELVWSSNEVLPYFKNIQCNFCKDYPKYNWETTFEKDEITKVLKHLGLQKLKSIRVAQKTYSRRVKFIEIVASNGKQKIEGNRFRSMLDSSRLYSTRFLIRRKGQNTLLFKGQGYGHGVGLCQAGAKTMAEKGYATERILNFYYKRIRFDSIDRIERIQHS